MLVCGHWIGFINVIFHITLSFGKFTFVFFLPRGVGYISLFISSMITVLLDELKFLVVAGFVMQNKEFRPPEDQ